jgi:hypothetical protein
MNVTQIQQADVFSVKMELAEALKLLAYCAQQIPTPCRAKVTDVLVNLGHVTQQSVEFCFEQQLEADLWVDWLEQSHVRHVLRTGSDIEELEVTRVGLSVYVPLNELAVMVNRLLRDVYFDAQILDVREEMVNGVCAGVELDLGVTYRGTFDRELWEQTAVFIRLAIDGVRYEERIEEAPAV